MSLADIGKETQYIYYSGLLGHRTLQVDRNLLWRWSWNGQLSVTLWKTAHSLFMVSRRQSSLSTYSCTWGMFLKWQDNLWWYCEGRKKWSLLWSPGTDLFRLIKLYMGYSLEMAGHSVMALGTEQLLIHIMVWKCMSLCVTWQVPLLPYDCTKIVFKQKV